ncbi:MAG: putative dsRNA-binding protein [Thermoleophilaceae bacterium]
MSSAQTPRPGETLADLLDELPADLARQAFTHASWVDDRGQSYERLAFLGDVVLSLAVSTHLYPTLAEKGAGPLTKVRAQAVSGAACAEVALEIGVPERLRAEAPEHGTRSFEMITRSERVLASVCEAVIGAAYLSFGFPRVAPVVVDAFTEQIDAALEHPVDYKSVLQERLARRAKVVDYKIVEEAGPAHARHFVVVAAVDGDEVGRGSGRTKKSAQQEAASQALDDLGAES